MVVYKKNDNHGGQPGAAHNQWSYKDRLLGVNDNGGDKTKEDEHILEEEDFSDDDDPDGVNGRRKKNVLCPVVDINRERHISLCRPWRKSLIIKVLGKDVGYKFLQEKIHKLWKISGAFELIDIPNNYWLVHLTVDGDFDYALEGGPWLVAGHYLMCQRWKPEFEPEDNNVHKQAFWVRISGLPI